MRETDRVRERDSESLRKTARERLGDQREEQKEGAERDDGGERQ